MSDEVKKQEIDLVINPKGYFRDLVGAGFQSRKITSPEYVKTYLVEVLSTYIEADKLDQSSTLAETYLTAQNLEPSVRQVLLKKVGEKALYVSGFFADSLNRKIIDIDYYLDMGKVAYASLASTIREETGTQLYKAVSYQFEDLVEVLTYVSENSRIQSDQGILRLYEKYLRTGSPIAKEKLTEFGVVALPLDQLKLGKQG